jgi:hypothetical protein
MQAYVKQGIGQGYSLSLSDASYRENHRLLWYTRHSWKSGELEPEERKKYKEDLVIEYKYQAGMYIYKAIKKIQGNGCIMSAHQFE